MDDLPLTRRRLLAIGGAVCLGAVAAACGAERKGGAGTGSDAKGDVTIDMKDIKYVPAAAMAKAGDKVVWTNSDAVAHTVTKTGGPGPSFDSGTIQPGDTYSQTVRTTGKIDYMCLIHPNQTGTLTVQ